MHSGNLYYNGFHFPQAIEAKLSQRPVMDSADRVVKYVEYTLTVECVLYPGVDDHGQQDPLKPTQNYVPFFPSDRSDIDGNDDFSGMGLLRRRLGDSGQALIFTDKGIGRHFSVSGDRTDGVQHLDVAFGPRASIKAWEPIQANTAIRLVWEVKFAIAECGYPLSDRGDILNLDLISEFTYSILWGIGVSGRTNRTITGMIEVLVERNGQKLLTNADQYRDRLQFTLPEGYQRESQLWDLSDDRRTLRFTITDVEHPSDNPLFPGMVRMDVRQRVSNVKRLLISSSQQWNVSLSGTIEVAQGVPRWWAWTAFLHIVRHRLMLGQDNAKVHNGKQNRYGDNKGSKNSGGMLITGISIEEELFGRSMSFQVSWKLFAALGSMFEATGIWQKIPNTPDWDLYRTSMAALDGSWSPRGSSMLKHYPENDVIIGFCSRGDPTILGDEPRFESPNEKYTVFSTPCPTAERSWVHFSSSFELIEDTGRMIHYPIGDTDYDDVPHYTPAITGDGLGTSGNYNGKGRPIYQQRHSTKYHGVWRGHAVRIGHEIPKPHLIEYGGAKAYKHGRMKFEQKSIKGVDDCVVYIATWEQPYYLSEKPQGRLAETNPDPRTFNQ